MLIITVYKLYYYKKNATREATYVIESLHAAVLWLIRVRFRVHIDNEHSGIISLYETRKIYSISIS